MPQFVTTSFPSISTSSAVAHIGGVGHVPHSGVTYTPSGTGIGGGMKNTVVSHTP